MVDLMMVTQLPHDLQSYTIMWYSNNGLQSITVAVDCGSALDYNGLAARTSLWLAHAGLDCGLGWLACYGIRHVRMRIFYLGYREVKARFWIIDDNGDGVICLRQL